MTARANSRGNRFSRLRVENLNPKHLKNLDSGTDVVCDDVYRDVEVRAMSAHDPKRTFRRESVHRDIPEAPINVHDKKLPRHWVT